MRIAIAEDSADLRTILKSALEERGHEVAEAADGRAALEILRKRPADVAVVDIFMPDMDGIETIVAIRAEFPRTRIVAISGGRSSGRVDYLQVARELGAAKCLRKPFPMRDFVAAVLELGPVAGLPGSGRGSSAGSQGARRA